MPTGLIGLIAICVVLVGVWVWINTLLIHKSNHQPSKRTARSDETLQEHERESQAIKAHLSEANTPSRASEVPSGERTLPANQAAVTADPVDLDAVHIEVMERGSVDRQRVFDKPALHFHLNDAQVPLFSDEAWRRSFNQLMEDTRVLGWIGFHGDFVGASDHAYDESLLEVLRTYRRSVEKLRQEVGLSDISETTVVGGEGKIWLLTALHDVWFALFLDANTDLQMLSNKVFSEVRSLGDADRS